MIFHIYKYLYYGEYGQYIKFSGKYLETKQLTEILQNKFKFVPWGRVNKSF